MTKQFNSARPSLAPLTAECRDYRPRYNALGYPEQHQCPECGEAMGVCDNCGGDYHELAEQRSKCPSKRLNNRTIAIDYEGLEADLRKMAKQAHFRAWTCCEIYKTASKARARRGFPMIERLTDHCQVLTAFADEIATRRNRNNATINPSPELLV